MRGTIHRHHFQMSDEEMLTRVKRIVRNDETKARDMVALYRKTHAGHQQHRRVAHHERRQHATRERAAAQRAEDRPGQGAFISLLLLLAVAGAQGQMKSYHTLDIPFALYNIDQAASMTGAMQDRYALAHKMSAAFASFARTGNPNHADLPNWPAFNTRSYPTMMFGNECKVLNDPNREERLALKAIRELGNTTTTAP
jgi:para-nitrobenzyl esterase